MTESDLRARSDDALVKLVLLALKFARTRGDLAEHVAAWVDLANEVLCAANGAEAFTRVLRYVFDQSNREPAAIVRIFAASAASPQVKEAVVTTADMLIAQGRQEGLLLGRQEGRQEGARLALLKILRFRFGDLPESIETRLASADERALERWTERVLDATSFADVFGD